MRQYEMFEISLTGEISEDNQAEVTAVISFEGKEKQIKGFYAGNGVYKVRFLPESAGLYRWKVNGAVSGEGEAVCVEAKAGEHGLVKPVGTHFIYEDGTRYIPVGTTVYALLHQEKELREQTMQTLQTAPFNKIRFCVFPKHFDFNSNEPEMLPFQITDGRPDPAKPCYEFWDRMEEYISRLHAIGIQADLILFHPYDHWGFARWSRQECLAYLTYAVRRLSAYPNIWWSLANEYDAITEFKHEWWAEFAALIRKEESCRHNLSNHNLLWKWDFANPDTTHVCLQSSAFEEVPELMEYGKPILFDECGYEGDIPYPWGNLSGFELVNRFWKAAVMGAYCTHGETFWNPEEILWWSKGGTFKGESVPRIAFLKEVLESLPGDLTYEVSDAERAYFEKGREGLKELAGTGGFPAAFVDYPNELLPLLIRTMTEMRSSFRDEVILIYNVRQCRSFLEVELPAAGHYTIELLDVWDMTRKVQMTGACGKVRVEMPGKEGIAMLALKEH
ncbi:DUF5060 domain-containing protein [Eisenbergiella porci]|uniref:DUF5060 domain-containing protein n=1 Tax=Eisenbergiella porci TaxID=2652274 RepID=UPI002A7EE057|nr:DUF4038 domain-containing protein [Eisenbergiella porci]